MKIKIVAAALAFAFSAAQPSQAQEAGPEIPFRKHVLKNGLTLIVHEDHKAPIVAVNVWYHVGSKNEKPGKTGFAHLFEHLMFNGSENFNDDYFKVLEKIGATDLNGTTNQDRTNYFQNVPTPALDLVLWMESDRMGHLLGAIDQARLDEQRGVVQNEKRQAENEPYGRAYDLIQTGTYPKGHPYSWTVIGEMEDLSAASLDDVKQWFQDYYGAANAVVVVAGDVTFEEAQAKVEKYFGDIPPGPPVTRQEAWIAQRTGTHRQTMQDRVPQARIFKVWNTPGHGTADDVALDLAARILATAGKTSRLYKRLVYDAQLATQVTAVQDPSELGGQFTVDASARPGGDLGQVEQAIDEELARFLEKGPTADELEAARTQYLAGFTRGIERIGGFGGKSDVLAQSQVFGGSPDAYKARLRRVREATVQQVWDAARRWLSDGQYVLTVTPLPEHAAAPAGVDRKQRPDPGPAPEPRFPAFTRATLKNGLKVIVAERRAVPVVDFSLLVDAGYASDQLGLPGTAKLAADMLDEGTKTRSSLEISSSLVRLGASLTTGANLDQTAVTLSALEANLGPSLDVFADVVLNPAFPEKDFERLKRQLLAAIERESAAPIPMALRVLPRLIYGPGHAYGNPLTGSGSQASVGRLTRDDVVKWHATWFKPGNATLIVVGDTSAAEIVPKLEAALAAWKPGQAPRKNVAAVAPKAEAGVYLLDRPGAIQSVIIAGHVASPKANPDEAALEAMSAVLGTQFISRMNMNLREDKHWSYGAGAFYWDARGPRPFLAYAPVQSDKTSESAAEMLKELRGIRGARPITADELQTAKNGLTLTLPGQWETGAAVAGSLADIVRFGYDDRYFDGYAGRIRGLTLEQVQAAGKKGVDPDHLVWIVVGDKAKVEAGLKELNLGPIRSIDADGNVLP
jgi:zinc protease